MNEWLDSRDSFIHHYSFSGGGGGDTHIKVTGMLVISLKGVNCRFRFHLGCLGRKVTIFAHSGISLIRAVHK